MPCSLIQTSESMGSITTDLPLEKLDGMINDAVLADLPRLKEVQSGQVKGRVVVDVNK